MCIRDRVSSLPKDKAVLTGTPIRQELLNGNKEAGRQFCGFTADKPVLMIIGGSLGAASVNDHVRKILPELLKMCIRDRWNPVPVLHSDDGQKSPSPRHPRELQILSSVFPRKL